MARDRCLSFAPSAVLRETRAELKKGAAGNKETALLTAGVFQDGEELRDVTSSRVDAMGRQPCRSGTADSASMVE